jgi:hypothetical protein
MFLETLDTPRSLCVWMLYLNGEHDQLIELSFNPDQYLDADSARRDLCATSFLSKATFLKTSVDRRAVALKKFISAEAACKEANHRILSGKFREKFTPTVLAIARRKIERVLGRFDREEFLNNCDFGPGASTSLTRRTASKPNKCVLSKDITREAYLFVKDWFPLAFPQWEDYWFSVVDGNEVTVVPKNAKTDRVIAVEPDWNIFFQKGVGSMIRRRLKYVGIDLNDQSINQEMSWAAVMLNWATVDFSSASDTIALELVRDLIPRPWLGLIEALRSSYSRMDGVLLRNEKFSSMGNGYTFELESLIFWALGSACAEFTDSIDRTIGVYGDDVILPCTLVPFFKSIVEDLGFSFNTSKSFDSGVFRESCGAFFFDGEDVKPIYLREELEDDFTIIRLANAIRWFSSRGQPGKCRRKYRRVWTFLRGQLTKLAPEVPSSLGDGGLNVNFSELSERCSPRLASSYKRFSGYEGYVVRCLTEKSLRHYCDSRGLLVAKLMTIGALPEGSLTGNTVALPESTDRSLTRTLVSRWSDIGIWA